MPAYRRRFRRSRPRRRAATVKKYRPSAAGMYRRRLGLSSQTHHFKRYMSDIVLQNDYSGGAADMNWEVRNVSYGKNYEQFHLGNLLTDVNNTSQIGGALGFNTNMLPALADFATLYDKYKIRGIKLTIIPLANFAQTNNLGTLPQITWAIDQDDVSVPADQDTLRQYGNCKQALLSRPVSIYLKPKMLIQGTSGGTGSASNIVTSPKFIDFNNNDYTHFGIKFWINNLLLGPTTNINAMFRFTAKYYLTCSQTR